MAGGKHLTEREIVLEVPFKITPPSRVKVEHSNFCGHTTLSSQEIHQSNVLFSDEDVCCVFIGDTTRLNVPFVC